MHRLQSLSARFTAAVFLTAATIFVLFVGLILFQMNRGLTSQADQLAQLSEEKLAERLEGEAKLAQARVRNLFHDTARRLGAIASRGDIQLVLSTRNVVAIYERLGPIAENAEIDAIVAVDTSLRAIGAHRSETDLLAFNQALRESPAFSSIAAALNQSDPRHPATFSRIVPTQDPLFATLGVETGGRVGEIVAHPFFDDFGDPAGLLIGLRSLKSQEPILAEFARLAGVGVLVSVSGETVVSIGAGGATLSESKPEHSPLRLSRDGQYRLRCVDYAGQAEVCAAAPVSELSLTRDELIRVGLTEGRALIASMLGLAALALVLLALVSLMVARQVTRPLAQITRALSAVARGEYGIAVEGTLRRDEIGDIARAVMVLQSSMEERDRLRLDVIRQNEALRKGEEDLRRQNLWFDAALNNMSQGLCMFDHEQRLIVSNRQFQTLYDLPGDAVRAGANLAEMMARSDSLSAPVKTPDGRMPAPQRIPAGELLQDLPDGRIVAVSRRPMEDGGWVATYEDITERKRAEARIAHLASHDALTDLANRTLFRTQLDQALKRQRRYGGDFAVLCLDLDAFKSVNDTLGHVIGDALLCQVANRLRSSLRETDLVARLGGDEFAILQMGLVTPTGAAQLAERMIEAIQQPYEIDGHQAVIGVSIGIALASRDGESADALMKNADLALYRAKNDGRNVFRFFEPEMDTAMRQRRETEAALRQALARNEFEPYFQPLVDLASDRIVGFEALIRWNHPTRGSVSPAEFIPICEEMGLIAPIGEWMLRQACREAARWPADCKVAVNISAMQIKHRNLTQVVMNTLAATGLPAERLELEITESVLIEEDEHVLATLDRIRALGVRFSMDDFGTGYSSLSCLRSFPFDKIKIDQSFVRDMLTDPDCAAIVRTVNNLARTLGMASTAEGVETPEQLAALRAEGCTEVQGYLLGRPMPADDVARLLNLPPRPSVEPGDVLTVSTQSTGRARRASDRRNDAGDPAEKASDARYPPATDRADEEAPARHASGKRRRRNG